MGHTYAWTILLLRSRLLAYYPMRRRQPFMRLVSVVDMAYGAEVTEGLTVVKCIDDNGIGRVTSSFPFCRIVQLEGGFFFFERCFSPRQHGIS